MVVVVGDNLTAYGGCSHTHCNEEIGKRWKNDSATSCRPTFSWAGGWSSAATAAVRLVELIQLPLVPPLSVLDASCQQTSVRKEGLSPATSFWAQA